MNYQLGTVDTVILIIYGLVMVGMGIYFLRKTKTSQEFMVAGMGIPSWAAGIAVMSAYTSSISYIAVPGKAFDDNWHPLIFALTALPVAWFVTKYVIPHYRKHKIISVYKYLEEKIGDWGRVYASFSFVLFMVGRTAVILYLSSLLLTSFIDVDIKTLILIIGVLTIVYTLMGGMEAVIWTDVLQSVIMIGGLIFSAYILTTEVFSKPDFLIQKAIDANKFSLGDTSLSFSSRTVWVMIIYGITENIRNLMADQNYTQKYSAVATEKKAKKSVWVAMLIYLPLTAMFLYIGTAMFAFYSGSGHALDPSIVKGDEVFPYFIATELPVGLKGLIIAAILAASMSTVDSALNSSATVLYLDYYKRYFNPNASEKSSIGFLRWVTIVWGVLGILFSLLLINAESALDIWWQISGIFGGGILGLFLLAIFNVEIKRWQGIVSVIFSVLIIVWGTFFRDLPESYKWLACTMDPIIVGAVSTAGLILLALLFVAFNKKKE
ncbi:sodium:solute symporter family transporter [Pseudozobellia thermophila]|uniref:Solute:Na+ symporter, SSS family n=1 Tax=Pseudozobellia thermophila TaxID=192903 RepID=A0A1M6I632_9FLAO|nr:sodium/solute symporter [Pseudozobellia thermophila]SHJ29902.1 solute:Na+ symporter, SSS family [Pseudozobellia thermophila]